MLCKIAWFKPQAAYSWFFSNIAYREHEFSQMLSNDLTSDIINQERQHQPNDNSMVIKSKIKLLKLQYHQKKIKNVSTRYY